ncbi:MAG TPA: NFACT family protein, partial [Deinococcales bacterium]|nr:NFACT family protein [Deinococcales bacterium]
AELLRRLESRPLSGWHKLVDGIGPLLTAEVAARSGVESGAPLAGESLRRAVTALKSVAADPSLTRSVSGLSDQARAHSREERLNELRRAVRPALEKRRTLLERQLGDVERARDAAIEAIADREQADTLLAFVHAVPEGASVVTLENVHDGRPVSITLDPSLNAPANANRLYARARRRDEVLAKLEEREPALRASLAEVEATLASLDGMDPAELESLVGGREDRPERSVVGARYRTRGGFEVLVGRNDRENDVLTHKVARSQDLWFHAQGYPGSHVVLRPGERQVPFEDVLQAAAIAAFHSKARGSSNVPVDYTLAKNVWRPRGARAGAVHYSSQKTVFVDADLPSG